MKKHNIPRRSQSEATYVKQNPDGDPFKIKEIKNKEDLKLFYTTIGLYLGEGDRAGKHAVKMGNSDPRILNIFLKFLRKICNVKESKIAAELNIFDDVNVEEAIEFWLKKLNLKRNQLKTVIIRKSNKKGTYKHKSEKGTFALYVSNVKLKNKIMEWCHQITKI